jgi:hypothetical protein
MSTTIILIVALTIAALLPAQRLALPTANRTSAART